MRMFVAVEVPSSVEEASRALAPEHLTLHFLGKIPAERVGSIVAALTPLGAAVAPFDLTLEGVGAFPSRERPRVVWVGGTEGAAELIRLAALVRQALAAEGGSNHDEPFVPHLTLFRVRSADDRRRAEDLLAGRVPPPTPRRVRVGEFVLKESELSSRGATHRTIATFPLSGIPPDRT
ncbi:MAG: RNA 2',3'-cyclic phosphodiesterase [Thermoplasmata archaeon]